MVEDESRRIAGELELGKIIYLPHLAFEIAADERRFLDTHWLSGSHKSLSYEPQRAAASGGVRGAQGSIEDLRALAALIARFQGMAQSLIHALFPQYAPHLRLAPASVRPGNVGERKLSWRKDDTLLHIDAFPSRPNHGERILRVFTNVYPCGAQTDITAQTPAAAKRVWKIGDLFEDTAREFAPRVKPPLPGSAALLRALHITKSLRSRYDCLMLGMHDAMKHDHAYQTRGSHLVFGFPTGSTWVCFSDQTAHAALSGQFMLEQTLMLPPAWQYFPERAPLRVLERLSGRALA